MGLNQPKPLIGSLKNMLKLVKYLITNIVDQPDKVRIEETIDSTNTHIISISVDQADMGRVIGKAGKIINSIRELVKIKAIKQGKRVKVILKDQEQTNLPSRSEPPAELPEIE